MPEVLPVNLADHSIRTNGEEPFTNTSTQHIRIAAHWRLRWIVPQVFGVKQRSHEHSLLDVCTIQFGAGKRNGREMTKGLMRLQLAQHKFKLSVDRGPHDMLLTFEMLMSNPCRHN